MASIKEVAKRAGVSTATVSRYINKSHYVDEAKAQAIKEAMDFYHYAPSQFGRGLKNQKANLIGVCIIFGGNESIFDSIYDTELLKGVEKALRGSGYSMVIINEENNIKFGKDASPKYIDFIKEKRIDGLLLGGLTDQMVGKPAFREILDTNFPIVYIGKKLGENDLNVYAQFEKYHVDMVRTLYEKGHRRIVMLIYSMHEYYRDGICKQVEEEMPDAQFELLTLGGANEGNSPAKDFLREWVIGKEYTAMCMPDIPSTSQLYNACMELNISVPEKLSVIAVESKRGEGTTTYPETSVYCTKVMEMGNMATKLLINEIEGNEISDRNCEFETVYIERDSIREL